MEEPYNPIENYAWETQAAAYFLHAFIWRYYKAVMGISSDEDIFNVYDELCSVSPDDVDSVRQLVVNKYHYELKVPCPIKLNFAIQAFEMLISERGNISFSGTHCTAQDILTGLYNVSKYMYEGDVPEED